MQKRSIAIATLLFSLQVFAQRGDELLVYAVKGHVTAIYKQKETAVKIGKVLLPGTVIKTEKDAALTMLCTKGKPLLLAKEGSFPVTQWKDSCKENKGTVSSNYFKYIWGQMYAYSPEHKEEMNKRSDMAVSRGGPPPAGTKPKKFTKLVFSKGMDTVNYDGRAFTLSWTGTGFLGTYHFTLYDAKGLAMVFKDSMRNSFISIDAFRHLLAPGQRYRWTVYAKGAPISKRRVLNYVSGEETIQVTGIFLQPTPIPEDSAMSSFRVAYMLEQRHFLAEAYRWYQKASEQNPGMELFRDQLIRFRNEYWLR